MDPWPCCRQHIPSHRHNRHLDRKDCRRSPVFRERASRREPSTLTLMLARFAKKKRKFSTSIPGCHEWLHSAPGPFRARCDVVLPPFFAEVAKSPLADLELPHPTDKSSLWWSSPSVLLHHRGGDERNSPARRSREMKSPQHCARCGTRPEKSRSKR